MYSASSAWQTFHTTAGTQHLGTALRGGISLRHLEICSQVNTGMLEA